MVVQVLGYDWENPSSDMGFPSQAEYAKLQSD